mgnify:CR=1 FL=1
MIWQYIIVAIYTLSLGIIFIFSLGQAYLIYSYFFLFWHVLAVMSSCPRQPTQTSINHYLAQHYSARLGLARWRYALLNEQRVLPSFRVPRAQVS